MNVTLMVAGLILFALGIVVLVGRMRFNKEAARISGTVAEIHARPAQKGRVAYYPQIRYTDPSTSAEETFESPNPYEENRFKPGDTIKLRYLAKGGKKTVRPDDWFGIWGLPAMMMLFGLIFAGISLLFGVKA
jgi:hypothetical protein